MLPGRPFDGRVDSGFLELEFPNNEHVPVGSAHVRERATCAGDSAKRTRAVTVKGRFRVVELRLLEREVIRVKTDLEARPLTDIPVFGEGKLGPIQAGSEERIPPQVADGEG